MKPINKEMVTVYFSDIVGFTVISSSLSASKVSGLLDRLYCKFDLLAEKYCVYKIDTIGDGLKIGCTISISFKNIDFFLFEAYVAGTNLIIDQNKNHASLIAHFAVEAIQVVLDFYFKLNKTFSFLTCLFRQQNQP